MAEQVKKKQMKPINQEEQAVMYRAASELLSPQTSVAKATARQKRA